MGRRNIDRTWDSLTDYMAGNENNSVDRLSNSNSNSYDEDAKHPDDHRDEKETSDEWTDKEWELWEDEMDEDARRRDDSTGC